MKLIKKYIPWETKKVKFNFYDIITPKLSFYEGFMNNELIDLLNWNHVVWVMTTVVWSEEWIKLFHQQFLNEGYEGTIIRYWNEEYKINSRSSNLLKYKDFIDRTAKVIDVIPSENRPEQWILVCEFDNKRFKSNIKFTHEERSYILTNKHEYI